MKSGGTARKNGKAFEAKVARWAKKQFDAAEVKRNQLFKGKTAVRPFEVDIVLWTRGPFLASGDVIWIECKDRKESIKRADIFKFLESARDVKRTVALVFVKPLTDKTGEDWDYLIMVSTAKFDVDAIGFAKQSKVACYYYDGRTFQEIVPVKRSWP